MKLSRGSGVPLIRLNKSIAFDGTAGNGATGTVTVYTITGQVQVVTFVPFCTESLAEAAPTATIALGGTGSTSLFIAATTATDIDINEFWVDATPDANGIAVPVEEKDIAITSNIIATVATQNITDGTLRFDIAYFPLSVDGALA